LKKTIRWTISQISNVISRIVERYSDFVTHPIRFKEKDGKEDPKTSEFDEAIWTRPRSEVTDEEYKEVLQTHFA